MYFTKLHTRQYATARPGIRAITTMATAALGAWCACGIGHADTDHEREACALMDDHATAIDLGYSATPVQYAFAVLSSEMPAEDAAHVIAAATRDDCPKHAADLPPGWL